MKKTEVKQYPIITLENCPYEVQEIEISVADQIPYGAEWKAIYDCKDIYIYCGLYVTFKRVSEKHS